MAIANHVARSRFSIFNVSFRTKIIALVFMCLLVFLVASSAAMIFAKSKIGELTEHATQSIEKMDQLNDIKVVFNREVQNWKNSLLNYQNKAESQENYDGFVTAAKGLLSHLDDLKAQLTTEDAETLAQFSATQKEIADSADQARTKFVLSANPDPHAADQALADMFKKAQSKLNTLSDSMAEVSKKAQADGVLNIRNVFMWTIGSCAIMGLLLLFIAWVAVYRMTRRLSHISNSLFGQTDKVAGASNEISEISTTLSDSVTKQAATLQETASAIDEISAMVKKSSENSEVSLKSSGASQDTIEAGKKTVDDMLVAIQEISAQNQSLVSTLKRNSEEFAEIAQIIGVIGERTKVINDIVFQTKLLSFNASVEAARAGEHGKGFAVVAEEVGNLAQMTGTASKEIAELLNGGVEKVKRISESSKGQIEVLISQTERTLKKGNDKAQSCKDAFDEIMKISGEVQNNLVEISNGSREQSQGIEQVNTAVATLDQVSQSNAEMASQSMHAAKTLNAQSSELRETVLSMRELLEGQTADHSSDHTTQHEPSEHAPDSQHQAA